MFVSFLSKIKEKKERVLLRLLYWSKIPQPVLEGNARYLYFEPCGMYCFLSVEM